MMMSEVISSWITAHPWMTFFIVIALIFAVENIILSFMNIFKRKKKTTIEATILDKDDKEIR